MVAGGIAFGGWMVTHDPDQMTEVHPIGDLREHVLGAPCWCVPFDDCGVLVHNSMDGREGFEKGRKVS